MEAYLKSLEMGKHIPRFRVNSLRKYTLGSAALLLYWTIKLQLDKYRENEEIQLKKHRLALPAYEMTPADYKNPPWKGDNYNEWKYRLIKVSGREIHSKAMMIPKKVNEYQGYAYILPLIYSENEQLEDQVAVIINKGWMPHEYKNIEDRMRFENSITRQEYVGMLNRGEEYSKWNFWKKGNVFDEQRWIWNNFYLKDMARAVKMTNERALRQGVIELLDFKETALDESDPLHYARDMSLTQNFPHKKTLSGALQPSEANSATLRKQAMYSVAALLLLAY